MDHLHYEFVLLSGNIVEVTLNKQANVRIMDSYNYDHYRKGERYTFFGGKAIKTPFRIRAPYEGYWHLAIDLGGESGTIKTSVKVIK